MIISSVSEITAMHVKQGIKNRQIDDKRRQ